MVGRFIVAWLTMWCVCTAAHASTLSDTLIDAIENRDWDVALRATDDGLMKHYLTWRKLLETEADFREIKRFTDANPNWPKQSSLLIKAEKSLFQYPIDATEARQWFSAYPAISGYGKLAYARLKRGDIKELVHDAWINGDFEREDEENIRKEFGRYLDATLHQQRAERLLMQGKASIAERLLASVSKQNAALYRARIALQRNEGNLEAKISAIPADLKKDDGLLADRAVWRHKRGLKSGTQELLKAMNLNSHYADALWRIRAEYARDAIEDKHYSSAASLLSAAGSQLSGGNLADALWLRGWLEFAFRDNPREAYKQFYELYHSVKYPVSKARGAYWAARAAEANDNKDIAANWYETASSYPTTFYGQLAQSKRTPASVLNLPESPSPDRDAMRRYERDPLVMLSLKLLKSGLTAQSVPLIEHMAQLADTPADMAALLAVFAEANQPFAQVRVTKEALQRHIYLLPHGWPSTQPPQPNPLEAALTFAIARQESEFNPSARSHADARGLMQLLPATAQKVARKLDIPYVKARLFEPAYNMRLGSQYLADLIDGFDGSHVLAIAGYNAGPGRSREWTSRFGQACGHPHHAVQWIEQIPFAETRNYVQRVLEHLQVYRHLLTPGTPLGIEKDLSC